MSLDFSDPRLTAYALDELDAAERAEVEAQLAGDPERRRLVEEIRATARLLTEHLQNEPHPKLTPKQREAIEARLQTAKPAPSRRNVVDRKPLIGIFGRQLLPQAPGALDLHFRPLGGRTCHRYRTVLAV